MTRLALSAVMEDAVVQIPKWFGERVVNANTELDRNPEYEREVILTKRGNLKSVEKRVPHHTSSEKRILRKLDRARLDVLEGRLTREGAQRLGEALHYIQDRCVPSPKFDRRLHDRVERETTKAHQELHAVVLYGAPRPVGRGELRKLLEQQGKKRAENGVGALRCATIYTFAAFYAVLANPRKAPEDFVERAIGARQTFSGAVRWVYAGAALASIGSYLVLITLTLPLVVGDLSFAMLTLFLVAFLASCPYACVLALTAIFSRSLQGFTRSLTRATELENLFFAVTALAFMIPLSFLLQLLTVLVYASAGVVVLAPYLSANFKMIRQEAFWFEWK